MLVLTRRLNEQIVVPKCELTFRVLEIRNGKIRIGITAPPDVEVYRLEVWARMGEKEAQETKTDAVA